MFGLVFQHLQLSKKKNLEDEENQPFKCVSNLFKINIK